MKKYLLALGLCAVLVGCGSSVKLDEVPVEDRAGTGVGQLSGAGGAGAGTGAAGSGAGAVSQSAVAPVDLSRGGAGGLAPAGARVIYFDYDSFAIKPEFQGVIEAQAKFIQADKNRKMSIEGHTDERGGREYNLALGQKRAEAVRRALGLLGVNDAQIEAVSFGKEKPAVEGSSEAAYVKNRRAEFTYR
jgi:peptidoglycan-associated lipoprotein